MDNSEGDVSAFLCLAELAFYYYGPITNTIVPAQGWATWPGGTLTAIFFFHFATIGAIAYMLFAELLLPSMVCLNAVPAFIHSLLIFR